MIRSKGELWNAAGDLARIRTELQQTIAEEAKAGKSGRLLQELSRALVRLDTAAQEARAAYDILDGGP